MGLWLCGRGHPQPLKFTNLSLPSLLDCTDLEAQQRWKDFLKSFRMCALPCTCAWPSKSPGIFQSFPKPPQTCYTPGFFLFIYFFWSVSFPSIGKSASGSCGVKQMSMIISRCPEKGSFSHWVITEEDQREKKTKPSSMNHFFQGDIRQVKQWPLSEDKAI